MKKINGIGRKAQYLFKTKPAILDQFKVFAKKRGLDIRTALEHAIILYAALCAKEELDKKRKENEKNNLIKELGYEKDVSHNELLIDIKKLKEKK